MERLQKCSPLESGADHHIRWSPETPIACNAIIPTLRRGMQPVTLCVTKSGCRASGEKLPLWGVGAIKPKFPL